MKRVSASIAVVFVLASLILVSASGQRTDQSQIQIVATVIGRSPFSGLIINPKPSSLHPELFVLRVDGPAGNLKDGQYVFVRYAYPSDREKELGLPKDSYLQRTADQKVADFSVLDARRTKRLNQCVAVSLNVIVRLSHSM